MKVLTFCDLDSVLIIHLHSVDKKLLQTVTNHPVHIQNDIGELSTSSFIPFCSFGNDLIGAKIKGLDIPVCDIFNTKIHNDQLCYETDLQELKNNKSDILLKQFEIGLTLILDYNEERQIFQHSLAKEPGEMAFDDDDNSVSLYLNTIGRYVKHLCTMYWLYG